MKGSGTHVKTKKTLPLILLVLLAAALGWFIQRQPAPTGQVSGTPATTMQAQATPGAAISERGSYTTRDDVAQYLHTYGQLPQNFITKQQARDLGWSGGDLRPYAPDKAIGGDRFGNFEGLLPSSQGRQYYECDIDTLGQASRGAKRLVYSNDGLIYYTDDHYESFTQLYGGE